MRPIFLSPSRRRRDLVLGVLALAVVVGLAAGAALAVLRLQANDAAIEGAHQQGMAAGLAACGRHP